MNLNRPIKIYCAVVVRYGRSVEPGFFPVFSVKTEDEAKKLLTLTCPINLDGEHLAPEVERSQTRGNLELFGKRLAVAYEAMKRPVRTMRA